jgi:hypothetical protein
MDRFAVLIDNIPKIVFPARFNMLIGKNTKLKKEVIKEEIF